MDEDIAPQLRANEILLCLEFIESIQNNHNLLNSPAHFYMRLAFYCSYWRVQESALWISVMTMLEVYVIVEGALMCYPCSYVCKPLYFEVLLL